VAINDPFYNVYSDINELPAHIMQEIRHFFQVYKALEGKETFTDVIGNRQEAEKIIKQGMDRYRNVIEPKVTAERKLRG
jgi:inorganic pyrophosphatase